MKKGWTYKRLGDLCRIRTGKLDANAADDDGLYPFFTCSVTPLRINKYAYDCECVLVAGNGDLNVKYYSGKFNAYQRTYIIESNDKNVLDVRYLYMFLSEYVTILRKKSIGAIIKYIKLGYLTEAKLLLPPISEQQSIVDYLDSAFAKIDAMKANAEKALGEAKALFQASLKEMLEPKEGWEEKILGDIAEDSADGPFGSNLKKEHYTTRKEVRIIQLSNIGEDGWREENTKYTTFEHLKDISRSEVEPNDIVIAKMMPAGRAILCPSHEPKFVLSSDAVKIKLKRGIETRFILHSINSPYFRNEVYENVTGSGRVRTSLTKLRACRIFLPSILEQQSIVATLDSLKSKVDRLQENYDKISQECDALKQAILRQVFE